MFVFNPETIEHFDLVITDITLPKMTGIDLSRVVRDALDGDKY